MFIENKLETNKGFTLIELLLVIAVIAILSGIILIGISSYRKNAEKTKIISEVSSVLNMLVMCYSDDGEVNGASQGSDVCSLGSGYGQWPSLPGDEWSYGSSFNSSGDWNVSVSDGESVICCNGKYSRCGEVDGGCNSEAEIN